MGWVRVVSLCWAVLFLSVSLPGPSQVVETADMKVEAKKRFALLQAAGDSDYVRKVYGGYFNVFVEAFGEAGETWNLFMVVEGEFSDAAGLDRYDGFVVTGSPHDAYGGDPWILRLCVLLRTAVAMRKKVLGVCFGHQVVCLALGGPVGKAGTGWDLGIRRLCMVKDLPPCKYLDGLRKNPPPCPFIIECHQDEVLEVLAGAEVIAFSEKTTVEMFTVGDHVLGIQGQPEYTKDILCNIIDRLANNHNIENGFAEAARARVEAAEPDRQLWETLCRDFLKGR